MKFPSLIKLPRNKSFDFTPRYYDPVKEDIERRTDLIKSEIKHSNSSSDVKRRISLNFDRRASENKRSTFIQLFIAIGITAILLLLFGI